MDNYTYNALPPAACAAVPTEAELADAAGSVVDQLTANGGPSAETSDAGNGRP